MQNQFVSGSYDSAKSKRDEAKKNIKKTISKYKLLSKQKAMRQIVLLCNRYRIPAAEMRQMVREVILDATAEIYGG